MRPLLRVASLLLLALLTAATAAATSIEVELVDRSPDAAYSVWITTTLDLSAPGQPVARVDLPPTGDRFKVDWQPTGQDYWVILHQRFQPRTGPPVDLFLPADLIPYSAARAPAVPLPLSSIEPRTLMTRERFSLAPRVLTKMVLALIAVFGGGFGLRWLLRRRAARPGHRCAPLDGGVSIAAPTAIEKRWLLALATLLLVLRLPGLASESLDLLEVSYLPGIGRPGPFADGATGIYVVMGMLRELAALRCLDLTHPPLYHAVMGVMGLFGSAEWLLRFPALLSSLATGWLAWLVFRRWSVRAGLLAFALIGCAAPSVYFGQDATPYAFVGVVAVGIIYAVIRALETGLRRWWALYFGLLVTGFLSHYNVAPFGLAAVATLLFWGWRGRADPRWGAAIHLAVGEGLKQAIFPVAWAWLHFSTFPTVAQDTRLVADTYQPDPGWLSFLTDFTKVTAGVRADGPTWALLGALPLVVLGLAVALRSARGSDRRLILELCAVLAVTFVASTVFFYDNARTHLAGRVFYGFRWVGWYHPVMLATAALGLSRGAAPPWVRGALLVVWMGGAVPSTARHLQVTPRPDYRAATERILAELEDGDAIASLPTWFQRGNLAYYLFELARVERKPDDGEGAWVIDGKRLTLEAVHAGLPFETTAISGHTRRLWITSIHEEMFGRDKFSAPVAAQAVAWADTHMEPDGVWEFDRIVLRRYRRPAGALEIRPGSAVRISSSDVVLTGRTYPPLDPPLIIEVPEAVVARGALSWPDGGAPATATSANGGGLGLALAYHAPMSPSCVDYEYVRLADELRPEAPNHWFLDLRVPLTEGAPLPKVKAITPAQVYARREGKDLRVTAVGEPCARPPLVLEISQPASATLDGKGRQ